MIYNNIISYSGGSQQYPNLPVEGSISNMQGGNLANSYPLSFVRHTERKSIKKEKNNKKKGPATLNLA